MIRRCGKITDNAIKTKQQLPQICYKYLWLLGQFIQHSLFYLQSIRVPEPRELAPQYPHAQPAELINIQRELYGCQFDWRTGTLIVRYKDQKFDVSVEAKEIVADNVSNKMADLIGFDDKGFDFNSACNNAIGKIIEVIRDGNKPPL
jgi:hypothetical protein